MVGGKYKSGPLTRLVLRDRSARATLSRKGERVRGAPQYPNAITRSGKATETEKCGRLALRRNRTRPIGGAGEQGGVGERREFVLGAEGKEGEGIIRY